MPVTNTMQIWSAHARSVGVALDPDTLDYRAFHALCVALGNVGVERAIRQECQHEAECDQRAGLGDRVLLHIAGSLAAAES